jgi:hypothetical protein
MRQGGRFITYKSNSERRRSGAMRYTFNSKLFAIVVGAIVIVVMVAIVVPPSRGLF